MGWIALRRGQRPSWSRAPHELAPIAAAGVPTAERIDVERRCVEQLVAAMVEREAAQHADRAGSAAGVDGPAGAPVVRDVFVGQAWIDRAVAVGAAQILHLVGQHGPEAARASPVVGTITKIS